MLYRPGANSASSISLTSPRAGRRITQPSTWMSREVMIDRIEEAVVPGNSSDLAENITFKPPLSTVTKVLISLFVVTNSPSSSLAWRVDLLLARSLGNVLQTG